MRKRERQQLLETLVRQERLSTQQQLVAALGKLGCRVTQATVSRDLRELGVQKVPGRRGGSRFEIRQSSERRSPRAALARALRESGASWQEAQNLVVVRSQPGTAPNVGRALDEQDHPDIIGTVAGDDTVLIVLADAARSKKMARYLAEAAGGG